MSIYWVAMWTVQSEKVEEHDKEAVPAILDHIRKDHPRVLSVRTWRVQWGAEPARPGRVWMEEYASLTAIDDSDAKESSPACKEVWDRIHKLTVPGTFRSAIWADIQRDLWNE